MTADGVRFERLYDATPDEIWDAITDPEQIERWLAHTTRWDARPGDEWALRFDDGRGGGGRDPRVRHRPRLPSSPGLQEERDSVLRFDSCRATRGSLLVLDHRSFGAESGRRLRRWLAGASRGARGAARGRDAARLAGAVRARSQPRRYAEPVAPLPCPRGPRRSSSDARRPRRARLPRAPGLGVGRARRRRLRRDDERPGRAARRRSRRRCRSRRSRSRPRRLRATAR